MAMLHHTIEWTLRLIAEQSCGMVETVLVCVSPRRSVQDDERMAVVSVRRSGVLVEGVVGPPLPRVSETYTNARPSHRHLYINSRWWKQRNDGGVVQEALRALSPTAQAIPVTAGRHATIPPHVLRPMLPRFVLHVTCSEEQLRSSYDYEDGALHLAGEESSRLQASVVSALRELFADALQSICDPHEWLLESRESVRQTERAVDCWSPDGPTDRQKGASGEAIVYIEKDWTRESSQSSRTMDACGYSSLSPSDVLFTESFLPTKPRVFPALDSLPLPDPEVQRGLRRRTACASRVTDTLFEAVVDEAIYLQPLDYSSPQLADNLLREDRSEQSLGRNWTVSDGGCLKAPEPVVYDHSSDNDPLCSHVYFQSSHDCKDSQGSPPFVAAVQHWEVGMAVSSETFVLPHCEDNQQQGQQPAMSLDDDFWYPLSSPPAGGGESHWDTEDPGWTDHSWVVEKGTRHCTHPVAPVLLSKDMLLSRTGDSDRSGLACLGQVDNRYIMAVAGTRATGGGVLLAVDQHAAHERVLLEEMTHRLHHSSDISSGERGRLLSGAPADVPSVSLPRTEMYLTEESAQVLAGSRMGALVRSWGFAFTSSDHSGLRRDAQRHHRVILTRVPVVQGEALTAGDFVEFLEHLAGPGAASLPAAALEPPAVQRVLASKACRTAIKFGDSLPQVVCEDLLESLSSCDFPFQCAHGRPSISPLIVLDNAESSAQNVHYFKKKVNYGRFLSRTD